VNGRYVYINPTFGKIFRCTLADLQGKTDDSIFPPDIVRALRENDQEVIESGQAIQIVEQVPHDGELHHWLATKFPVFDGAGNLVMVAGMAIDISERVRAEARMRDLERAAQQRQRLADIGAITAQIVHDLGNPIAAVSMQAQLIVRRARREGNEGILKAAEQIVSRVRHLDTMVREFLDFTREQRLALTNVDLRRLLSEVVDLWRPVASSHTIAIDLDLPSDVPPVVADEEKLRRVFDNLIKNAVEAIDSGPGSVTVRVSAPNDERVRVSIEDTGPGIPQNLEVFRLFETTKSFGTGLGLPISQQIVLVHGGGIEFAAVEPHGTVFHVDLRRKGPAG
jgi:PAS domain S-box-containing protein